MREAVHVGGRVGGKSLPFPEFCCELKTALKIQEEKNWFVLLCFLIYFSPSPLSGRCVVFTNTVTASGLHVCLNLTVSFEKYVVMKCNFPNSPFIVHGF